MKTLIVRSVLSAAFAFISPFCIFGANIIVTGSSDPGASAQQLQAAVNSAQPGDVIQVSPNVYTGPIYLVPKSNPNGLPITIQSSAPAANLPGAGVRTGPQYSPYLPQITSQNGLSAIQTQPGASYYNLVNLELRAQTPTAFIYTILVLGSGGSDQTTLSAVPQYLKVDRCYIHGYPNANFKGGIQLNSGNTNVINSYISEFHSNSQDSLGINGFNGPGPYQIVNNYIESAANNILFGGAVPAIPGNIPSNILIAKNDFVKQLAYKNWVMVDSQTYASIAQTNPAKLAYYNGQPVPNYVYNVIGAYTPNVKNMIEFKFGQDVTIIANTFTNTYVQADQFGQPLVLTPRTENGQAPWATVQRINIANNIFQHEGGAITIGDKDTGQTGPVTNGITLYNNLFDDLRTDYAYYDHERLYSIFAISNIRIDHNTMLGNYQYLTVPIDGPVTNLVYTDNIGVFGQGFGSYCGNNASAWACSFNGYTLSNDVLIGGTASAFPTAALPTMFFPPDVNSVGFVNAANLSADYHNYALAPGTPYKGKGLYRTDPGFLPNIYDLARKSSYAR